MVKTLAKLHRGLSNPKVVVANMAHVPQCTVFLWKLTPWSPNNRKPININLEILSLCKWLNPCLLKSILKSWVLLF